MKSHLWRVICLVLIVASASCSGKGKSESQSTAGIQQPPNTPSLSTGGNSNIWIEQWRKSTFAGKDSRKLWDQYSKAAQAELDKPGADPSDLTARANTLGRDPQKVFEFIRDQISLEPYAGVLRGARGTLMAGAGNALDRALLAQELLKAVGIESRLVAGKLSDAKADSLLARFLERNSVPKVLADFVGAPDDTALKAEATELAVKVGLSENSIEELLRYARAQEKEYWAKTDAQRATQFDFLDGQLRKGGVKTAINRAALSEMLKERLRKHYWLQVRESEGTWSEFDPTFSDAKRGTAYGTVPTLLSEVPIDEYHQLEFSLVYRTLTNGEPKDEVLIAGTFPSADALFAPLEFRIQPADGSVDLNSLVTMQDKQRIDVLRKIKHFQPVLRAGSQVFSGRRFDLDGNTYDAAGPLLGNAGGSFFGDAFGGGDEEALPQFVELRVAMRLTGPGREMMSQTRTLVRSEDLMAPTFAPPILGWEILLQPQWLSAEYVGFQTLNQTVASGNALMAASNTGRSQEFFKRPSLSEPVLLLQMALLRQRAAAEILVKQGEVHAFVDEPVLTIMGHGLTEIREQENDIIGEQHIDIVENGIRYLPSSDASQSSAFDVALRQSVADSTIEDRLVQDVFPGAANSSGTTIIEQAQREQRPVHLADSQDVDKLRSAGAPESDIVWIHENESPATRLVVATTESGSNAWWSVGPDGNAILRSRGGRGIATEKAIIESEEQVSALQVAELASWMMCIYEIAEAAIAYLPGPSGGPLRDVPAMNALNVAVCVAGQLVGARFAALGAHSNSWALLGGELGWHVGQKLGETAE